MGASPAAAATSGTAAAAEALVSFARYVLQNGLKLVDSTGFPTTWGFWDPTTINYSRRFSDTRGVNSLEALAMISGALFSASPFPGSNSTTNDTASFLNTLHLLLSPDVAYHEYTVNLKIAAPVDDNFSDDELTFVSYLPLLTSISSAPPGNYSSALIDCVKKSLGRTWALVTPTRPSAWHVFALGLGAATSRDEEGGEVTTPAPYDAMVDVLWGLRGWPLEPVDWPVDNSERADLFIDNSPNRDMRQSQESRNVFPPNERPYSRLNSDPCDLRGGSGMYAFDQGAFLLPYFLARLWGLVSAPTGLP